MLDATRLDRLKAKSPFFRRGEVDGWRQELAPAAVAALESQAGEAMCRFGYESVASAMVG